MLTLSRRDELTETQRAALDLLLTVFRDAMATGFSGHNLLTILSLAAENIPTCLLWLYREQEPLFVHLPSCSVSQGDLIKSRLSAALRTLNRRPLLPDEYQLLLFVELFYSMDPVQRELVEWVTMACDDETPHTVELNLYERPGGFLDIRLDWGEYRTEVQLTQNVAHVKEWLLRPHPTQGWVIKRIEYPGEPDTFSIWELFIIGGKVEPPKFKVRERVYLTHDPDKKEYVVTGVSREDSYGTDLPRKHTYWIERDETRVNIFEDNISAVEGAEHA